MSQLLACGVNHQTAHYGLREKLVFPPEQVLEPLLSFVQHTQSAEVAILSTCNRTEFYCVNVEPVAVIDWLYRHKQLKPKELEKTLYFHHNADAVRHVLRVASGLDSVILGEPEIAGQVKKAFTLAAAAGTLGNQLRRLANYIFAASKQVRSQTAIGVHPISLASAAVHLGERIFADLTQTTVLLIGAGQTIELIAKHLHSAKVSHFIIANRTMARAEKIAGMVQGKAINLTEISQYLPQADIVIAATASPVPVLGKGMVESALKIRKHKPMFMVDLAIPRDIEPEISQLDDIYLSTLEDLQAVVAQNMESRQACARHAEEMIETQVKHFMGNLRIQEIAPVISAYRKKAELLRDEELIKAMQLLQNGLAPTEVLTRFANGLTNKLLHTPSVQLRQAAYDEQQEILETAQWLFDL